MKIERPVIGAGVPAQIWDDHSTSVRFIYLQPSDLTPSYSRLLPSFLTLPHAEHRPPRLPPTCRRRGRHQRAPTRPHPWPSGLHHGRQWAPSAASTKDCSSNAPGWFQLAVLHGSSMPPTSPSPARHGLWLASCYPTKNF